MFCRSRAVQQTGTHVRAGSGRRRFSTCARRAPVRPDRQKSAAGIFARKPRSSRVQSKCVASFPKIENDCFGLNLQMFKKSTGALALSFLLVLESSAREPQKHPPASPFVKQAPADKTGYWWSLPVVAETWDGWLNDVNGFHVKPEDVWHALESAHGGAIEEGSVGGGTGMICYEFKGGTGTASRVVPVAGVGDPGGAKTTRTYTIGALVQADCGRRAELLIAGVPVGREIPGQVYKEETGSIIIAIATDAPLLPHQLKRLARRASLGLARTGSVSANGSGDLFIAFSTANAAAANPDPLTHSVETIPNDRMDPIFAAVVQATEEAIVNALVDNQTMTGRDNHRVDALPHDRMRELLKKYNRLAR